MATLAELNSRNSKQRAATESVTGGLQALMMFFKQLEDSKDSEQQRRVAALQEEILRQRIEEENAVGPIRRQAAEENLLALQQSNATGPTKDALYIEEANARLRQAKNQEGLQKAQLELEPTEKAIAALEAQLGELTSAVSGSDFDVGPSGRLPESIQELPPLTQEIYLSAARKRTVFKAGSRSVEDIPEEEIAASQTKAAQAYLRMHKSIIDRLGEAYDQRAEVYAKHGLVDDAQAASDAWFETTFNRNDVIGAEGSNSEFGDAVAKVLVATNAATDPEFGSSPVSKRENPNLGLIVDESSLPDPDVVAGAMSSPDFNQIAGMVGTDDMKEIASATAKALNLGPAETDRFIQVLMGEDLSYANGGNPYAGVDVQKVGDALRGASIRGDLTPEALVEDPDVLELAARVSSEFPEQRVALREEMKGLGYGNLGEMSQAKVKDQALRPKDKLGKLATPDAEKPPLTSGLTGGIQLLQHMNKRPAGETSSGGLVKSAAGSAMDFVGSLFGGKASGTPEAPGAPAGPVTPARSRFPAAPIQGEQEQLLTVARLQGQQEGMQALLQMLTEQAQNVGSAGSPQPPQANPLQQFLGI